MKVDISKTAVSVSTWCASHSSSNFRNPDSFVPERWLDDPQYQSDKKLASRPFSLGPRGCIGKESVILIEQGEFALISYISLSYVEQRLTVARMVWNFDLVNTDEAVEWSTEDNMKNIKAFSTWQKPGLSVVATDRQMPGSKYWSERK